MLKLKIAFYNIMTVLSALLFILSTGALQSGFLFDGLLFTALFGYITYRLFDLENIARERYKRNAIAARRRAKMTSKRGKRTNVA